MKRSASLDLLRGGAAFAVAIPHYLTLNAPFQPLAEAFAIAGVEVFFVLSGFVLAPQIVDWVVGRPWRNLGVFLARRWMRTIPPYVVALIVIALMTGNLMTADFVRYLLYVENLFVSANHTDFYPVAWSLAVEEWFYVLFAPALFVVALVLKRRDRSLEAGFAILVIVAVAAVRFALQPHDWDLNVRRVTLFRIDSIVWGFLLYLALERFPALALDSAGGAKRLAALIALPALFVPAELSVAILAVERQPLGPAGVSLRFGGVRHGLRRRLPAGGRSFSRPRHQGRELLSRPHLVLRLSLSPDDRHGAEADDRNRAAGPAARDLCRPDPDAVDDLLCRI